MKETQYTLTQHITETKNGNIESLILNTPNKPVTHIIFYIHGYNLFGAWDFPLFFGKQMLNQNWTYVALSQLGFGESTGKKDYCGPRTQDSLVIAIEEISKHYNVPADNRVVWGISRGAIVTSVLAGRYPEIAAGFICQSGAYDFKKDHEWEKKDPEIVKNMDLEIGDVSDEAYQLRSGTHFSENISKPMLILHGEQDPTIDVAQAYLFEDVLKKQNKQYELHVVDGGHGISGSTRKQFMYPFIKKIFGQD